MNSIVLILMARGLAICYIALGIGIFINKEYYQKAFTTLLSNSHALLFSGVVAILLGVGLISYYPMTRDINIILPIFGWIAAIEGVLLLILPNLLGIVEPLFQYPVLIASLSALFGAVCGYWGFFVASL